MIGASLAHYKILERIGAGGMGEVFVADDCKLHRRVALKILPREMASDPRRRERFEREAKAVAALNHPNIVTIYSIDEAEGIQFLTMELVPGKNLDHVIPEDGLALDRFFDLVAPLADALSAAHAQGITHRDLKPGNIMVTGDGRVKVLDFGLAKLRQGGPEASSAESPTESRTAEGQLLGTVPYMSPEQAQGRSVDHRSDIFSLGVILHELATGRRPFQGASSAEILSSILRDTPHPVTSWAGFAASPCQDRPALPGEGSEPALSGHPGPAQRSRGPSEGDRVRGPRSEHGSGDADTKGAIHSRSESRRRSVDGMQSGLRRWSYGRPLQPRRAHLRRGQPLPAHGLSAR